MYPLYSHLNRETNFRVWYIYFLVPRPEVLQRQIRREILVVQLKQARFGFAHYGQSQNP